MRSDGQVELRLNFGSAFPADRRHPLWLHFSCDLLIVGLAQTRGVKASAYAKRNWT
jgi:hypothetical protein